MATEYISREEMYQANKNEWEDVIGLYDGYTVFSDNIDMIDSVPVADVQPVVHGHWVYEEPNGANSFKGAYWCDQCHQPEPYRRKFCPNCGADMRE